MIGRIAARVDRSESLGRAIDLVGAAIALVILAPVIAAVSLGVRITLGRPVLFRQVRTGWQGRPFTILKFRTMEMREATCCCTPEACRGIQMAEGLAMSRFATLIRRTGLDELPQLLNILRGEMSFVGPRPLLPRYLARYSADQQRRHEARPGITGWAQVNGRTDLSWNERLDLDVWYVANRSRSLDARIMKRTIRAALGGEGFSQSGSDTGLEFIGIGVPPGLCPATELPLAAVCPDGAPVALAPDQRPHTDSTGRVAISGAR
jgi:lipopolysaccharide/colanic/teichoic acid biosynthesis glycosyltransferase